MMYRDGGWRNVDYGSIEQARHCRIAHANSRKRQQQHESAILLRAKRSKKADHARPHCDPE
jgi:hypothetical protein